jgi:signal transduction histidine kinase
MASLGTLTSGVAHELNNPLSNISTSTQIMMEELGEADLDYQKKLLSGVEEQVEKARDIVRSLLEFAREGEFELGLIDVGELIEKTLKLVKGELPAKVEVRVDVPERFQVEVDQRRLSQALINLVLNGVQAMADTGGVLKIGAYRPERGETFRIEVEDTGPGIPPEDINHVFEPFFTTKNVGEGTGLGLYVTYGIIQKHNGRIEVTSRPGQGAKFVLSLPIRRAA